MDPVLIVGGGIVGLTLGQALKQRNIPFEIYERDLHPDSRGQGWAITLHWALHAFKTPQVDPDVARNDNGNFLFINLATGEPRFKIPPSKRWRGKRVDGVSFTDDGRPQLLFRSGEEDYVAGKLVVGIEGSRSSVRSILRPDAYHNVQLPVAPLRDMDPLLFQGCHPETGVFLWFSILETPANNANGLWRVQINLSWPAKTAEDEVPSTDEERLANMKKRAAGFVPFLYETIQRIPDGTPVLEIDLADWECLPWDNRDGRVTLAGDAAHAMVMYRGEAANHGLLDIFHLVEAIANIYAGGDQKAAIDKYESEMRERTAPAVRLSRQACIEAHAWEQLKEGCAVLSRRKIAL
ncbi:hypothetical protein BDW71DRAFT_194029 [Aspergillus fruticulosus]